MKVIFLDIDGVLCTARTAQNMDVYATTFLVRMCEQEDIKIVVSSTWRKHPGVEKLFKSIFEGQLHEDWRTPILDREQESGIWTSVPRGREIQDWLDSHEDVEKYLILDDDSDMLESQKENHIKPDNLNGILFEEMRQIEEFFGVEKFPFAEGDPLSVRPNLDSWRESSIYNFERTAKPCSACHFTEEN